MSVSDQINPNTVKNLSLLLGISTKQIRRLQIARHLSPKGTATEKIVQEFIRYREGIAVDEFRRTFGDKSDIGGDFGDGGASKVNLSDERIGQAVANRKKAELEGTKLELEIEEKLGNLVPLEDFKAKVKSICETFRGRLLAIPSKLAPALVGWDDQTLIEAALREELNKALGELSTK